MTARQTPGIFVLGPKQGMCTVYFFNSTEYKPTCPSKCKRSLKKYISPRQSEGSPANSLVGLRTRARTPPSYEVTAAFFFFAFFFRFLAFFSGAGALVCRRGPKNKNFIGKNVIGRGARQIGSERPMTPREPSSRLRTMSSGGCDAKGSTKRVWTRVGTDRQDCLSCSCVRELFVCEGV